MFYSLHLTLTTYQQNMTGFIVIGDRYFPISKNGSSQSKERSVAVIAETALNTVPVFAVRDDLYRSAAALLLLFFQRL